MHVNNYVMSYSETAEKKKYVREQNCKGVLGGRDRCHLR